MRTTKRFFLLGLLLMAAMILAACPATDGVVDVATPAAEGEVDLEPGETVAPEPVAEGVTQIMLAGWASSEAENERLQEVIDQFNEANENIQVSLNQVPDYDTWLQTSLAGGSPPDVFYVDSFRLPDLVEAGAIEPYEPYAENPDDFYDSLRQAFTIDGTFYCPPKDFSTLALVYNVDIFEEAGIEPPTADWTWEDLESAATAISENVEGTEGLVLSPDFARFIAFLYQAGGEVANEDFTEVTINSEEALEALTFYTDLVLEGAADTPANLDAGWAGEAFGQGRAAMAVEGNWVVPYLQDNFPDLNWDVIELPEGPAGHATMAFTVCYAVPTGLSEERQAAAFELVNYLVGPEGMEAWTDLGLAMPTRESLRDQWIEQFPELQPFLDSADFAFPWQFRPGFQDFLDTFNAGLEDIFAGSALPEDVLEEAEAVGEEVLAR